MAPKARNPNASAVTPKRSVTIRTSGTTTRATSTSSPRRSLIYNVEGSKKKQNLSGELIKKTQLSADRQQKHMNQKGPAPQETISCLPYQIPAKAEAQEASKVEVQPESWRMPTVPTHNPSIPRQSVVSSNFMYASSPQLPEEYYGPLCRCMGLLCDWHPQGRWPNNQVYTNRDNCVCCGGKWFPSRQEVMNKWCIALSTEIFDEYVVRFFPQIPWEAYNLDYTRLEDNDDFPTQGRNPMNVIQEQQNLGAKLAAAKDNTWIAYNTNHHPIVPPGTAPDMYASITWDEYLDAIEAGFSESQLYARYLYERLLYSHDWAINAEEETENPTISRWEWFNFDDILKKWFHMPSTGTGGDFFRRLFEAAAPNGMILDL